MVKTVIKLIVCNLIALCFVSVSQASLFQPMTNQFAPADQAFDFSSDQQGNNITLQWRILDGYYLYRHKIEIEADGASLGEYQLPVGKAYHDEVDGDIEVFTHDLQLAIPLNIVGDKATLKVNYQGCTDGFCYPPETATIKLLPITASVATNKTESIDKPIVKQPVTPPLPNLVDNSSSRPFSPLWALIIGITIAFTPCVLPMYPLITSIILGQQHSSNGRTLALAICYVQGMALTYTLLGLVVAASGLQFQAILQHSYILIGLSLLFMVLALSMFGIYDLQLPTSLQTKLTQWSNYQQGGKLFSVFIMGAIAGLICSPCTTAPLAAILLYIAQNGNLYTGAITLYLYALGMGIPLIFITVFGNNILPRSGPWMVSIKHAFGFVILAMPIFLLERVIGDSWALRLWSILGTSFFCWGFLVCLTNLAGKLRILAIVCLMGAIICARPLQDWIFTPTKVSLSPTLTFKSINSLEELNTSLHQSKGKTVLLDFYADWCVACKEFDKYTFMDPAVQSKLKNTLLLRVDVTSNTPQHQALFKHYQVLGLPSLLWFDEQGKEQQNMRINGFMNAENFIKHIDPFLKKNN